MKVCEARTPPNGWHFPISEQVKLEAPDKKTLIDRLFEYRLRHGLATGTEETDIDTYFCTKWPSACNQDARDYGHPNPPKSSNEERYYRVARWAAGLLDRMPRGGYAIQPRDVVLQRAAVCRSCPKNNSWKLRCSGCAATTKSLLNQIRRMQPAPEGLFSCEALGFDCGTAVYLNFESLPINEALRQSLPENCWRK